MVFSEKIKFYGTYRPYQQRVLDNLESFLDNEKIHVVAAPGSGKTTLGLELIRRLDQASLVLVPSIAIREQWINRFLNSFTSDKDNSYISNNIKEQKPIICITYQALYSAFKREENTESSEEIIEEQTNYEDFDLMSTIKKYNIKTVCLDECHHLKSEWWKVLEKIIAQIENCRIIALTATPPYDSSSLEWQRYIDLCGPIDEEIFVPELIKDNNLCPHQDFVYFSLPTDDETKSILNSYANGLKIYNKYKNDPKLIEIVCSNQIYNNYHQFKKAFYNDETYYSSLVLFLLENNIKVPFNIKLLVKKEKFSIKHLEILLQNILFNDQISYKKDSKILSLKKEFSALGIVHNKIVNLVHDDRINKKETMSLSKLESIKTIVNHEYNSLKDNLKCLILTDYIKLKNKNDVCNDEKEIDSFGTIPIFEYLRRSNIDGINLCCLSGSICIIPKDCAYYLDDEFKCEAINNSDYVEVIIQTNNRKKLVSTITKLFENGKFNVLIGTKSLLGEGWDSPCINTLILASFIGSYVLSNQMRGRAIRTDKNNPNKKSNVWHLVCLDPFDFNFSNDYYNLKKRFTTFVGIDSKHCCVENGMERLGLARVPYNQKEVDLANKNALKESFDRENIKNVWDKCINDAKQIDTLCKQTSVPKKRLKKDYSYFQSLFGFLLSCSLVYFNFNLYKSLLSSNVNKIFALSIFFTLLVLISFFLLTSLYRFIYLINAKMKLLAIGKSTLKALQANNTITSKNASVFTKNENRYNVSISLINASTYEQNIFSNCITQMLSKIDQPRYLIAKPKYFLQSEYYVVPDIFKRNKTTVKIFVKELSYVMGSFEIIFAKNESGKNTVLKAKRINNFKYKEYEITTKNVLLKKKNID